MNQQQARQHLALNRDFLHIIEALAEDGVIQVKSGATWWDFETPVFDDKPENYRRKPKLIERWMVVNGNGTTVATYDTKEEADRSPWLRTPFPDTRVVHVREVEQ